MAAQPMWLHWPDSLSGRTVRHAPDFFARRADGTGVVIDVRADERDVAVFAATAPSRQPGLTRSADGRSPSGLWSSSGPTRWNPSSVSARPAHCEASAELRAPRSRTASSGLSPGIEWVMAQLEGIKVLIDQPLFGHARCLNH